MISKVTDARQSLELAGDRLRDLRSATENYFAAHPYRIHVAPHEQKAGYDLYRFKLAKPVPLKVLHLARQTISALLRARRQLGHQTPATGAPETGATETGVPETVKTDTLTALQPYRQPWRRCLVPGAHARTVLAMDGDAYPHPALLHAPVWNAARREIVILRKDPDALFKGKVSVEFYLQFTTPLLRGQSALGVLATQLQALSFLATGRPPAAVRVDAQPAATTRQRSSG